MDARFSHPAYEPVQEMEKAAAEVLRPRIVEQLLARVGQVPLRDIVRESTDLIERLCIEAALTRAGDNRALAAEMLGLSRQSLYAKLHRHGMGNLGEENLGSDKHG
jgi:DNA-binding NtrC family response regulator